MQHKLLRKAGLLTFVFLGAAFVLTSCIDEPDPPVNDQVISDIRFVQGIHDAPAVDIWVDSEVIYPNMNYSDVSGYLAVKSGSRFIRLVPAGQDSSTAIFRRSVSVRSVTQMTMVFYSETADPQLLITQERFTYADETSMLTDSTDVKLINVSDAKIALKFVEVITEDSSVVLIDNILFEELSAYERLLSRTGLFAILSAGGDLVDPLPSFELKAPGYRYSLVAIGSSDNTTVLALQDEPK